MKDFLEYIRVVDWPVNAAPIYGRIRTHLKERGTPIGAMDLMIAAHASFLNSVLITDNVKEFKRVPGLEIENWIEQADPQQ